PEGLPAGALPRPPAFRPHAPLPAGPGAAAGRQGGERAGEPPPEGPRQLELRHAGPAGGQPLRPGRRRLAAAALEAAGGGRDGMGTGLGLAAQLLGCALSFFWARLVGRDWAERRLAGRFGCRLRALRDALAESPFDTTLALRLLPVGNNLALNLLAGMAGVAA